MTDRIFGSIGLANKAGLAAAGAFASKRAILEDKAELVIIAADAAESTKVRFCRLSKSRGIEVRVFGLSDILGHYCGKGNIAVLVIKDDGFARKLVKSIDDSTGINGGGLIG